ncbi:MAG: N-acetyltransferase [Oscillospiraceae bacterium]|nr:N-acetyltransferase [Oscillospiraceae bacterium]
MMNIRQEIPADYRKVEELTREAFWNVYRPGCVEHFILHNFRNDAAFIPELSLVCEKNGKIVGHIMYCRARLSLDNGGEKEIVVFGPLSVAPSHQREGIGSELIRRSLKIASEMGFGAVAITGSPAYYSRFGFESGSKIGVYYDGIPREEEAPFFMVKELEEGYLSGISAVYRDPDGYSFDEDAVEAFDSGFASKEKKRLSTQMF